MKKYLDTSIAIIIGVLLVVGSVQAATTISENIATGGTLSVTGTSTLIGQIGIGTTTLPASVMLNLDSGTNEIGINVPKNGYQLNAFKTSNDNGIISAIIGDFEDAFSINAYNAYDGGVAIYGYADHPNAYALQAFGKSYFSGNVGIGTTTPSEKLVVDGNLTVTGTTNGVKVYRALLTQTGTNAPVATVLENSLGGEVVWTRVDVANYQATLTGAFPQAKTWFSATPGSAAEGIAPYYLIRLSDNVISLSNGDTGSDDQLSFFPIEILVYP